MLICEYRFTMFSICQMAVVLICRTEYERILSEYIYLMNVQRNTTREGQLFLSSIGKKACISLSVILRL